MCYNLGGLLTIFFSFKHTQLSLQGESKNSGDAITHTCSLMLAGFENILIFFSAYTYS